MPRVHFGIAALWLLVLIEFLDRLDDSLVATSAGTPAASDVVNRVAAGVELDALEAAGQEAAAPLARGDGLIGHAAADAGEDDEAGQVVGSRYRARS